VANQQNAIKSDSFASRNFEIFNLEVFAFGNFVLLAAGHDNCVHLCISVNPAHPALYRKYGGWHGCMGPDETPVQLRKAGKCPWGKFRVRDCTHATGVTQGPVALALTVPEPAHSMPRNLRGVPDATP